MDQSNMTGNMAGSSPVAAASNALIVDTTTATFMADVVEASRDALVLVDFWAAWCGPCKQLTPILEKVVMAANGAVRLAKMDIEAYPEISGQMGVQSIPAVFAFKDGRPVDGFAGALAESEIKAFIEKHAGPDVFAGGAGDVDAGLAALDAGDLQGAADIFSAVLAEDPANPDGIGGLAGVLIASGDLEQAETVLATAPADKTGHGAISKARAELELARQSATAGDTAPLLAKIAADPNDHESRIAVAVALAASGQREEAVEHLIESFTRKRDWNEEAARKQLVQLFEAWGPTDPATMAGRRRLSLLMFS